MTATFNFGAELDAEDSLAHQGELFTIGGELTLAAGVSYKIGLQSTKNITFIHSRFRSNSVKVRSYLYEGIAFTGGTVRAPVNRNREHPKQVFAVVSDGVTATVSNPIGFSLFGSQPGPSDIDEPFILKKNTPYIQEFVNDALSQTDTIYYSFTCCELDL